MEHLEFITKIVSLVTAFLLGMNWVVRRIESGQKVILNEQKKLLKKISHKVDKKECAENRAKCPCFVALKETK